MDREHTHNGRILTRRQLGAMFSAPLAVAIGQRAETRAFEAEAPVVPDCVALPRQTEGPYFVDEGLKRSDLRSDPATGTVRQGVPLDLRLLVSRVTDSGACVPLAGAAVDIWHCDAAGQYSDVRDRHGDTVGQKFLRGYQVTDAGGRVRFTTIYPGWYPGRAVHVHFKVRVPSAGGRTDEFTSQFYFSDELTDRVHARAPYPSKRGQRLLNARDMLFRENGAPLVLPVVSASQGYAAAFTVAMKPG